MAKVLLRLFIVGLFIAAIIPQAFAQDAYGNPVKYEVKVAKVELYNGSDYITVFDSESVALDIASVAVAGPVGNFLSGLVVPDGTYTKVRVTPSRTFTIRGSVNFGGANYYTTGTVAGTTCTATAVAGNLADATITVAAVTATEQDLPSPVKVVDGDADHTIRVSFSVTNAMAFTSTGPGAGVLYPQAPTVTISLIKNG